MTSLPDADDPYRPPRVPAPVPVRSVLARWGVVLAILLPPVGLAFSLVVLVHACLRGGPGRSTATAGIVMALGSAVVWGLALLVGEIVAHPREFAEALLEGMFGPLDGPE